jgi:hypothetical protein
LDGISEEDWNAATAKFNYVYKVSSDLPSPAEPMTFSTALLNTANITISRGLSQLFTCLSKRSGGGLDNRKCVRKDYTDSIDTTLRC